MIVRKQPRRSSKNRERMQGEIASTEKIINGDALDCAMAMLRSASLPVYANTSKKRRAPLAVRIEPRSSRNSSAVLTSRWRTFTPAQAISV